MCRIKSDEFCGKVRRLYDDIGIRNYSVLLPILDNKGKFILLNLYLAQYLLLILNNFKRLIFKKVNWLDKHLNHCMNK